MTIEDKKQQENLKNFDRNLKASTDTSWHGFYTGCLQLLC